MIELLFLVLIDGDNRLDNGSNPFMNDTNWDGHPDVPRFMRYGTGAGESGVVKSSWFPSQYNQWDMGIWERLGFTALDVEMLYCGGDELRGFSDPYDLLLYYQGDFAQRIINQTYG